VNKKRLFFALLPDQEVHDQLVTLSRSFPIIKGVRPVPNNNLHITLQFLGDVEANERKCLEKKVVQTYVQSLTRLNNHLKSIAEQCGTKVSEKIYKPHVTLFKNVPKADFPDIPFTITWHASEFHLLESVPHENTTRYNKLATYSFLNEKI